MCFSGLRENGIAKLRVQLMVYMFLAGPLLESVLRHCIRCVTKSEVTPYMVYNPLGKRK